ETGAESLYFRLIPLLENTGGGPGDGLEGTNKTGADLNGLPRPNAPVIVYFREIRTLDLRVSCI
ncbi:MAG: hypothetical protein OXS28_05755, partial [Gammaproteobacteria bacterium]|nr:hypothetical protein [Gammaproteobacteria bacterium]